LVPRNNLDIHAITKVYFVPDLVDDRPRTLALVLDIAGRGQEDFEF
jgi:hypothetical protein